MGFNCVPVTSLLCPWTRVNGGIWGLSGPKLGPNSSNSRASSRSSIYKLQISQQDLHLAPITKCENHNMASPESLMGLLEQAAYKAQGTGIRIYTGDREEDMEEGPLTLSYNKLWDLAKDGASRLLSLFATNNSPIILLHVSDHYDAILWFWIVVAAGGIPCMSTPLPNDMGQRKIHLKSLQKLLKNPLVLTTDEMVSEFSCLEDLRVKTIKQVTNSAKSKLGLKGNSKGATDVAVLMLTSGSTGNAKAVALTHKQIISAIQGKIQHHQTTKRDVFLNWTRLDHVANLTEIHLHAMSLGATQHHLPHSMVIAEPILFLQKIAHNKVSIKLALLLF